MITILSILFIINILFARIFKYKPTILCCGLFGFISDDVFDFSKSKLNLLGVLNEKRGIHSCGISYDSEIYHGVYKTKVWRDFANENVNSIPSDFTNPVVVAHTRWATGGQHNRDNSHPFGFGNNKDGDYEMIGAHNGSLLNKEEIAEKFNVDLKDGKREKIDSEILLEAIYKNKDSIKEILEFYEGAAALTWYYTNEPNTLYIYHGKSKMYKNSINSSEERPMYLYKENFSRAIYYSSLKESLNLINDDGGEVFELEHNKVFKIHNGEFVNDATISINREEKHHKKYKNTSYKTYSPGYNKTDTKKIEFSSKSNKYVVPNVVEKVPNTDGKVTIKKLRYFFNDVLATGIFTSIKNNDMYFLSTSYSVAVKRYNEIADSNKYSKEPIFHYFYEGTPLESKLDYGICLQNYDKLKVKSSLSFMSKYPVLDLKEDQDGKEALLYKDGNATTKTFIPFLSKNIYISNFGKLSTVKEIYSDYNLNKPYIHNIDKELYETMQQSNLESDESINYKKDLEALEMIESEISDEINTYEDDALSLIESEKATDLIKEMFKNINETLQKEFKTCQEKINKLKQSVVK